MEIIIAFVIITLFLAALEQTLEWLVDNGMYYICYATKSLNRLFERKKNNE